MTVVTVKYDDLATTFEFVSAAPPMENSAYISIDTGAIHWMSGPNPLDDEVPDDLETSDRYIAIPHKNDLDLGRALALRFAAQELPDHLDTVEDFFRHRGAYARFKALLESEESLDKWYNFEAVSTEKALRAWCAENDIRILESNADPERPGT